MKRARFSEEQIISILKEAEAGAKVSEYAMPAEMLRRQGYDGPLTLISADADPPIDRPNLSKDYLAGAAQEDWIPLWPNDFYVEHRIDLVLGRRVASISRSAPYNRPVSANTRRMIRTIPPIPIPP